MGAEAEAAYVTAPMTSRVIRLAVTDTAARFAIPAGFAGMPCEWTLDGADGDIVFGGSSVAAVYDQASSVASEAITVHASSGQRLKNGVSRYFVMPPITTTVTHFSVDCAAGGSADLTIAISGAA